MADEILSAEAAKCLLDYDSDTGVLKWRVSGWKTRAGEIAGHAHSKGYLHLWVGGKKYLAHRLAWLIHYGEWPADCIDHKNMVKTDNRIANLRVVTNKQNHENKAAQSNCTSGTPGVAWYEKRKKWIAYIKHHGKRVHLGYFIEYSDAVKARIAAEADMYTHRVVTNYVDSV